ncbi:hypothetical protein [Plebeiibacterium sediminum]|uniref:Uncharacterized protein n=1 Tax=Plebeiibacterium sediminum TaxID=2992112 RepID=A0AAE3M168_9BACT|nr:hypothetical protein [Plebeiobacterium sediminum]MCW3785369.1 hypothetical protein [Plebeiobacterium sediminum]
MCYFKEGADSIIDYKPYTYVYPFKGLKLPPSYNVKVKSHTNVWGMGIIKP